MIHKLFEMYDEPEVIPTWPEEFIPNVLVCPICLSIPFDPWVETKCSRVFCKKCIQESVDRHKKCPICQCGCYDLTPLNKGNKVAHQIWSDLPVRCENHEQGCTWTGSLSDYKNHVYKCNQTLVYDRMTSILSTVLSSITSCIQCGGGRRS